MREEKEISDKIEEVREVNRRKKKRGKKPNPEREDIAQGLETVLEKGKYGTLHEWEEKKKELKRMEKHMEKGLFKYCKYGIRGEIIPGDEMDSIAWKIASYGWALGIRDPDELKIFVSEWVKRKIREKQKR